MIFAQIVPCCQRSKLCAGDGLQVHHQETFSLQLFLLHRLKAFEESGPYKAVWGRASNQDGVVSDQPPTSRVVDQREQMVMSGGYIRRVTNDAREDEMEQNLAHVGSIMGNLKSMALDISNELESQGGLISRINEKANVNVSRIEAANQKANNLMKR
uniref:Synaptosomal-associated protein n=1 Tax=Cyprinodon variegatus TaxID=28743 RepID=A0A3Q2DWP0_CYPVA